MVRCVNEQCNKALGERMGAKLFVRRIGVVFRGGLVDWCCENCGKRQSIDLEVDDRILAGVASG